jgi:hypothetical protein
MEGILRINIWSLPLFAPWCALFPCVLAPSPFPRSPSLFLFFFLRLLLRRLSRILLLTSFQVLVTYFVGDDPYSVSHPWSPPGLRPQLPFFSFLWHNVLKIYVSCLDNPVRFFIILRFEKSRGSASNEMIPLVASFYLISFENINITHRHIMGICQTNQTINE